MTSTNHVPSGNNHLLFLVVLTFETTGVPGTEVSELIRDSVSDIYKFKRKKKWFHEFGRLMLGTGNSGLAKFPKILLFFRIHLDAAINFGRNLDHC